MTKGNEQESMARLKKLMTVMDSMNDQGQLRQLASKFLVINIECVVNHSKCSRWLVVGFCSKDM